MTPEEWHKIGLVVAPASGAGIVVAILASAIQRKRTVAAWVIGSIAGGVAAAMMALGLHDSGWPIALQGLCIGVAAYNAGDLLEGLRLLFVLVKTDPLGFVERFWKAIRGGGGSK
jgi:hypothetical protein